MDNIPAPYGPDSSNPSAAPRQRFAALRTSRHKRRNWLILIALVLLLAGGSGVITWKLTNHKAVATAIPTKPKHRVVKAISIGKTTFYTQPIKTDDLHFFKDLAVFGQSCSGNNQTNCPNTVSPDDISYYRLGTTADRQPIIDVYDSNQDQGAFSYVAVGSGSGTYKLLGLLDYALRQSITATDKDGQQYAKDIASSLSSNVSLDTTAGISELDFPAILSLNGTSLQATIANEPRGYFLSNGLASIRGSIFQTANDTAPAVLPVGSDQGKTIYQVTAQEQANYAVKELYASVNAVFAASYTVNDPLVTANDDTLAASWTGGEATKAAYNSRPAGCGSATGYIVAKNLDLGSLTIIGSGPDGQTLYQLPTDSPLFKEIYSEDYASGMYLPDASMQNLTATQFQAKHGVFIAKNTFGEPQVYLRSDMIEGGGCGKPVIYLYPQKPTKVSVQVAAMVTKSAPQYTATGWQNILALPGSRLFYNGSSYNSLYWEGKGNGDYPLITSGIVVPQSKAVATIRQQLDEQGLTITETNEFLAYWQPRLPRTPYVRLTWFNTSQMNALAPLTINPRPTTLIRTFLDFQGLQQPVQLAAQHFKAPDRTGFTVVEWGGLLRNQQ